jgi:hypothetical protein
MARTDTNRPSQTSSSQHDITDAIRKKAYELYEKRGKRPGRAMNDWLEAEKLTTKRNF